MYHVLAIENQCKFFESQQRCTMNFDIEVVTFGFGRQDDKTFENF